MTDAGRKSPPMLHTVRDTAAALSMGVSTINAKIKSGQIKSVKIGRSRRIPHEELERLAGVKG